MRAGTQIARNFLAGATGKAVVVLVGLFTFAVLARHLGADGLGEYRTVLSLLTLGGVFANFGIYFIMLREISVPNAPQAEIVGTAMALHLVSTFTTLVLFAFILWLLPYDPVITGGVLLGSVGWTAYQGSEVLRAVFQQRLLQGWVSLAEIIGTVITLSLVLLIAKLGGGVLAMLAALTAGFLVRFVVSWSLAVRLIPFRLRFDLAAWRKLVWAGAPIGASLILQIFILRGDTVVLSLVRSSEEVGIYSVAIKVFEIVTGMAAMFGGLMMPFFTRHVQSPEPRFAEYVGKSVEVVVFAGMASASMFMLFAAEISVLLAGPEFYVTGQPLRILGLAMAVAACSHVMRFALVALSRQADLLRVDMLAAMVALVGYVASIPRFSYMGAAWSTLAAELVILGGVGTLLVNNGYSFSIAPALRIGIYATIVMTVTCLALSALHLHWILSLLIGFGAYAVTLGIFGVLPVQMLRAVITARSSTK